MPAAAGSAILDAYRRGYVRPPDGAATDGGIRSADAWVSAHDPLRASVAGADLALGVDPGSYFCGGLAALLAGRRGGFVHVPNDAVMARGALLDAIGAVVAIALDALAPRGRVLLTGFGPFPGVPDNPTAAFVADAARVAAAGGGREVAAAVLRLAGPDGAMYPDMAPVAAQLAALGPADTVLALGVDSRQRLARPRFAVETQSWGMRGALLDAPVMLDALPLALLRINPTLGRT